MNMDGNDYIAGLVYFEFPNWGNGPGNWMAIVTRDGETWKVDYRFRYYRSDAVFDGEDDFHWFSTQRIGGTEEENLQQVVSVATRLTGHMRGTPPEIFHVQGDAMKLKELTDGPLCPVWFHCRVEVGTSE